MPRGKYTNHKGRGRRFTNPDELEEERRREEREKAWKKTRGDSTSSDEEEEGTSKPKEDKPAGSSDSDSESDDESDEDRKAKGVEKLIEIQNPNRIQNKTKKRSALNETLDAAKPELSRKEREEIQRQQAAARYQKMHAEGKTMEAQADLARLAIIKQQRENAAKKRETEKQQKEAEAKEKAAMRDKALGKKS